MKSFIHFLASLLVFIALGLHAVNHTDPCQAQTPSYDNPVLGPLLDTIKILGKNNPSQALRLTVRAIHKADSLGEPLWKARFLCHQGICYRQIKMYDEALKSQYNALANFQRFHDSIHIAKSMYEIGKVYTLLEDYERALAYHFNALYLREYDSNLSVRAMSYLELGNILMQQNEYWRSLDFLLNARTIFEGTGDSSFLSATMISLGELMLKMQRYNEAFEHLDRAIDFSTQESEKATIMLLKASLLQQQNMPEKALQIALQADKPLEEARDFSRLLSLHNLLADIYQSKGDLKKALFHIKHLNAFGDSLRAIQRLEEITRLQFRHETQQLEASNEILKLQLKEADFRSRNKGYLIAILLFAILIAIGILVLYRNKRASIQLQQLNAMLEQKVQERTAELHKRSKELEKTYAALKKSEAMFRAINETVPLGIAVTDIHGRVNLFNPPLIALGFDNKELLDQSWLLHIVPEEREKIMNIWEGAHKHRKPIPEMLFRIALNNRLKWLRMRGMCLELEEGFSGMVIVMEDFSDIKKVEQELIKAKEKAEDSDRLKSAFLANMSHEIRTPMNAILGFADLLPSMEYTEQEKKEFINTIQSSGQLLLNLINDIIDISKIEAGELKIIPTTFELGELMETLRHAFLKQLDHAEKQHIRLILSNREACHNYTIHTDKFRLQQILTNLLSNAIKFTKEGQIEFGVIRISDQYEFYVKDTGIGIPSSKLDIIFERFRQADDSHTKQYGGTGLGLAISKHLTHLLGGKIWVESVEGKGTSFYFTLPGLKTDAESLEAYPDYSTKKVLVVEDVEANFHLISNMLKRSGITFLHAPNGYIALDLAQSEQPDLILMDIQLPELDGLAALKSLRKQQFYRPVVAITAFALADDAQYYLRQGFDSYLSKPLGVDKLYGTLQMFFDPELSLANK